MYLTKKYPDTLGIGVYNTFVHADCRAKKARWDMRSKVRCAQGNKGKSGGIRVIYYWVTEDDQIFFLVAYPKSVKDNLTDKETSILRQLVKEQFHG